MRKQKRIIALIVVIVVAGWGSLALCETAVTVNTAGANISKYSPDRVSLGWRFFVDKSITITHFGLFDADGPGLQSTHTMALWRLPNKGSFGGGPVLVRQVTIGPGAESGDDNHVYVSLNPPITLDPNTNPYEYDTSTGKRVNYERWLLGVWSPDGNQDKLVIDPVSAVTVNAPSFWHLQPPPSPGYTYDSDVSPYTEATQTSAIALPWGGTVSDRHWGMNFKFGPQADAGPNVAIYTSEQAMTVILGIATHAVPGTSMDYQWLEGSNVLQGWTSVTFLGANLNLAAPMAAFSVGEHILKLEVRDAAGLRASDMMTLTIDNTPPAVMPAPASQVKNDTYTDPISINAQLADFDGDQLSYTWREGDTVLGSGQVSTAAGGEPVSISPLVFAPGQLMPGSHQIQLVVSDGVNDLVTGVSTIQIVDTTMPTLSPMPDYTMLWPPDHALHSLRILANAADNSGGPIVLTASVASSEPADDSGDGSTEVDCCVESVDSVTGTILVQLRAERSGTGDGRVYAVTITATDTSNNQSTARVEICVPHDKRKK